MQDYQAFRANPAIARLAERDIWTVSTKDKCPVDIYEFRTYHKLRGARYKNELSLADLDTVTSLFPEAVNRACYLDAASTGLMVLDIEPSCPEPVKERLLRFPCLYAERSMSGHGYHLLMRTPDKILRAYPAAGNKLVMKHELGWYEFLLNHYVTFTGDQVPHDGHDTQEFLAVFINLAKKMTQQQMAKDIAKIDMHTVDRYENDCLLNKLVEILSSSRNRFTKTAEDYGNDLSKYEFALVANRYACLQRLMRDPVVMGQLDPAAGGQPRVLTENEIIWTVYKAATNILPHRAKHDTFRNGMPFLMYDASVAYAKAQPMPPPTPGQDQEEEDDE